MALASRNFWARNSASASFICLRASANGRAPLGSALGARRGPPWDDDPPADGGASLGSTLSASGSASGASACDEGDPSARVGCEGAAPLAVNTGAAAAVVGACAAEPAAIGGGAGGIGV